MSNVPNVNSKVQIESMRYRSAVSESLIQILGGCINQLFDDRDAETASRIANDAYLQGQITSNDSDISYLQSITGPNFVASVGNVSDSISNTSYQAVNGMSLTIGVTVPGPVYIFIIPFGFGGISYFRVTGGQQVNATPMTGWYRVRRDSSVTLSESYWQRPSSATANAQDFLSSTSLPGLVAIDSGAGGSTVYNVDARVDQQNSTISPFGLVTPIPSFEWVGTLLVAIQIRS